MTTEIANYIKDIFNSSAKSHELHYLDHAWAERHPELKQRKPIDDHKVNSICQEFSWFIFNYLCKENVSILSSNFSAVLQGFSEIIMQQKVFNNTPAEQLHNVPEKFTKAHAKTGSVPTLNIQEVRDLKSKAPMVGIAKGVLTQLAHHEPSLQTRLQLLLDINDYLALRSQEPEYKSTGASIVAKLDFFKLANRFGMNIDKKTKIQAVEALRAAVIAGDNLDALTEDQITVLNSSRTQELYQRFQPG